MTDLELLNRLIGEKLLDDYDSDEDEDWRPEYHVNFDEEDDEILEYESTDDDSDYSE